MTGNQSGADKHNRLLFGEQWTLLFSKSKMALFLLSQSGIFGVGETEGKSK